MGSRFPHWNAEFLILAAAALLLLSVGLGWYSITASTPSASYSDDFSLFGTQAHFSSNNGSGPVFSASSSSYPAARLPETGLLYACELGFVGTAIGAAFVASFMILRRKRLRHRELARLVVVLTIALAVSAPLLVFAAQPSTLCSDAALNQPPPLGPSALKATAVGQSCASSLWTPGGGAHFDSGTGPQSSFVGVDSSSGQSLSWGPSFGWYLAALGAALAVLGGLRFRAELSELTVSETSGAAHPRDFSPGSAELASTTQSQVPPRVEENTPRLTPSGIRTVRYLSPTSLILVVASVLVGLFLMFSYFPPASSPGNSGPRYLLFFGFGSMTAVSIPHGGKAIAGCAAGTAGNATIYCEIAQIAASSPAASTSSIGFALRSPSGVNLSFATVTLLDRFGNGIAQYTPGGTVGSWALCPRVSSPVCNVAGSTNQTTLPAPINTTETLVLQVTPTAATGGTSPTGDVFLAVGLAPYSGSVTVNCP